MKLPEELEKLEKKDPLNPFTDPERNPEQTTNNLDQTLNVSMASINVSRLN